MNIIKRMGYLLFTVMLLISMILIFPVFAEEATITLPSLNPTPTPALTTPTGLPQMETGEQLPSFDNPNINVYRDSMGKFTITFPQGSTLGQSPDSDLITFILPDQAKAYIPIVPSPEEALEGLKDIEDDILGQGGTKVGQSTLQIGTKSAIVTLYGMEGGALGKMTGEQFAAGITYAILMVHYPGTNLALIVVIPKDTYKNAQTWILETLKGVVFQ